MTSDLEILRMAQSLSQHAARRQSLVAANVAHADTPGFRARDLPDFAETYAGGAGLALAATRSGHVRDPLSAAPVRPVVSDGPVAPNGNSVTLEEQMLRLAEISSQHQRALAIYRKSHEILRLALGRGR